MGFLPQCVPFSGISLYCFGKQGQSLPYSLWSPSPKTNAFKKVVERVGERNRPTFFLSPCSIVYGALLTKTNRISRIFNASKQSAQRPNFISPKSQLCICSGIVLVQVIINVIWFLISPPEAMHHHPTREDNLLVCKVNKSPHVSKIFICKEPPE